MNPAATTKPEGSPRGAGRRQRIQRYGTVACVAFLGLVLVIAAKDHKVDKNQYRVAVLIPGSVRFFDVELAAMKATAAKNHIDVSVYNAHWSASRQVDQVRALANDRRDVDAIALCAVDSDVLGRLVRKLHFDVPLVTFTNGLGQDKEGTFPGVRAHIGRNEYAAGHLLAAQVDELGLPHPNILVVAGSPGTFPERLRSQGFDDVAAARPSWNVVEKMAIPGWDLANVQSDVATALKRHKVDVIVVQWADAAVVVSRLFDWLNLPDIPIVTLEWTNQLKREMRNGHLASSTSSSVKQEGQRTIETLATLLHGGKPERWIPIHQRIVTREEESTVDAEW